MIWAFLVLAPSGVLTARYLKQDPRWFQVHLFLQYSALVAAVCGAAVALVDLGPGYAPFYHGPIGILAVMLMALQPVVGWFRPDKGLTVLRALWFQIHAYGGRMVLVIGTINIVTGLQLAYQHRWGYIGLWVALAGLCIGLLAGAGVWLELRKRSDIARTRAEKF